METYAQMIAYIIILDISQNNDWRFVAIFISHLVIEFLRDLHASETKIGPYGLS